MKKPERTNSKFDVVFAAPRRNLSRPSALPQSITTEDADKNEKLETFDQFIIDAKLTKRKPIKEDNPLGKWIAFVKTKNKKSQRRKEAKRALKVACYNYYDARSPSGNISHFMSDTTTPNGQTTATGLAEIS